MRLLNARNFNRSKIRAVPCESSQWGDKEINTVQNNTSRLTLMKLQSQTKIVATLPPNAVFSLLTRLLVLPMLVITGNSPNVAHHHREGKKTAKCPNNFDWDCSYFCVDITRKLAFAFRRKRVKAAFTLGGHSGGRASVCTRFLLAPRQFTALQSLLH